MEISSIISTKRARRRAIFAFGICDVSLSGYELNPDLTRAVGRYRDEVAAAEMMSPQVVRVYPNETLYAPWTQMTCYGFQHLPVVTLDLTRLSGEENRRAAPAHGDSGRVQPPHH